MGTPVTDFNYKTKPYDHQLEALKKSCFLPNYAYLCEMGTGKSKIIIDNFSILYLAGKINTVIIIAPNSVYRNWLLREIPTHISDDVEYRVWVHKRDKPHALQELINNPGPLNILLINVEAFSTKKELATLLGVFMELTDGYIAVDESTTIKSKSKRTQTIIELGKKAKYRRIATGLIAPNGPMNIYWQYEFLSPDILGTANPIHFKAKFCKIKKISIGSRSMDKVYGVKNVEILRYRMDSVSFRVTKEECLDLPDKIYDICYSEMDEETIHHYKKMKEEALFEYEHEDPDQSMFVRSANRLNMLMRLQMITCGHMKDKEGKSVRFSRKRIEDMMEWISMMDKQLIIWSVFVRDVEDIVLALQKEFGVSSVASFYGGTSLGERSDATERFQAGKLRFIVSNQATGRYGNTWTAASNAFYYSNNHDLDHRSQSEDRIHRIGQTNHCLYTDEVAPQTVNWGIVQSLRGKITLASVVMGDEYRKWLI